MGGILELVAIVEHFPLWLGCLQPVAHTLIALLFHSCYDFWAAARHFHAAQLLLKARPM